uniref:Secreted protein n=1 Tax=Rousettus aegyptiacus TaxID=9407 RepID=A0A7J8CI79_ROUAE|nr:hypothetical protein HJG63_009092 [Rousettus aegyptiacus]
MQSRIHSNGTLVLVCLPFGCVFRCDPRWCSLGMQAMASSEKPCCRPSSATACALLGATWHDLPSNLTCLPRMLYVEVSERPSHKLRLAATNAVLGAAQLEVLRHAETRCCLFGLCEHLRDFRKVLGMS